MGPMRNRRHLNYFLTTNTAVGCIISKQGTKNRRYMKEPTHITDEEYKIHEAQQEENTHANNEELGVDTEIYLKNVER